MEPTRRSKKTKVKFPTEKHTAEFLRGIYCFTAEFGTNNVKSRSDATSAAAAAAANPTGSTSGTAGTASADSDSEQVVCGICLEDASTTGRRFGLLSCDHCFCLSCVMKWRRTKPNEKSLTRSCPTCRKNSEFVVPSKTFCVGTKKEQIVTSYLSHLSYKSHVSTIPCKRFTGYVGSCPFGAECFYAHYDSSGQDIKRYDLPMRKDNGSDIARLGGNILLPETLGHRMEALNRYIRDSLYDIDQEEDNNSGSFDASQNAGNEDADFFAIIEHEKMMLDTFQNKI